MYFATNHDLFVPLQTREAIVKPWKPAPLAHDQWPPDYRAVFAWRIDQLTKLRNDSVLLASAKAYYRNKPGEFIQHWMDTYNPRKVGTKWMPFVFFARQDQFIDFLEELRLTSENGLVEKCRDIGATWLACAYSVWCFLFLPDDATGWGSRKQELVDKLGDPDSIFEKMRLLIKRLPDIWLPQGFKSRDHATFMKLINPERGGTITGESGDNIGRGGRKARYFKDESAHYERPEKIEAALGDNTDVQIDISSVNGLGNVFHRRRESGYDWSPGADIPPGETRVFIFDWRDHPEKTIEWYNQRKAKAEREGMQHVFAQEVDRNYSAALQNRIIDHEWIVAAYDAHLKVPCLRQPPPDVWMAGLDVADEGLDRNALALRQWVILRDVKEWGERDAGVTARKSLLAVMGHRGIHVQYDSIGVGSTVKAEYNRICDEREFKHDAEDGRGLVTYPFNPGDAIYIPWNAGDEVQNKFEHIIEDDEQSLLNKDFFENFKAQAWWSLRSRFYKTWRAVTFGDVYRSDELISLDSSMTLLQQLTKELSQPVSKPSKGLRTMVDKKPPGTKSPNLADAVVQCFFPAPDPGGYAYVGNYSG